MADVDSMTNLSNQNNVGYALGVLVGAAIQGGLTVDKDAKAIIITSDMISKVDLSKVDLCIKKTALGGVRLWLDEAIDPNVIKAASEKMKNGGLDALTPEERRALGMKVEPDIEPEPEPLPEAK